MIEKDLKGTLWIIPIPFFNLIKIENNLPGYIIEDRFILIQSINISLALNEI